MNNSTFQFEPLHPETKPKFPKSKWAIALFIVFGVIAISSIIIIIQNLSNPSSLGKLFFVNKDYGNTRILDLNDDTTTCNLPALPRSHLSWDGAGGLIGNTVLICGGRTIKDEDRTNASKYTLLGKWNSVRKKFLVGFLIAFCT